MLRRQDVRSWQDRFVAPPKPPVEVDTPVAPPSGNGLMPNLGGPEKGGRKSTELDFGHGNLKFSASMWN